MAAHDTTPQSVTSAWVQSIRREGIAMRHKDVARVVTVGIWLSSFGNADGTSVKPSQESIAALTGYSVETVSRCIKVLVAAGLIVGKRRPNKPTEYRLVPMMQRPRWNEILPILADNRHRERHRKEKEQRAMDSVRAQGPEGPDTVRAGSPDTVRAGVTNSPVTNSDTVRARGRSAGAHAVRTPCAPGGTMSYLPPVVTSPEDLDTVAHSPQPQVDAGGRSDKPTISLVPPVDDNPGAALVASLRAKADRRPDWRLPKGAQ